MDFYIVDAFSDKAFGGNTAGVVLYDKLDNETKQMIASELRFSETAFINMDETNTINIRYFTPTSEIDLCGHATIASFKVLLHKGIVSSNKSYCIKTRKTSLSAHILEDSIFLQADKAVNGSILQGSGIVEKLCMIMGLHPSEIGDANFNLVPQIVSTGLFDIMLPVKSSSALSKIKPDFAKLSELSKELNVVGVHAFTLDTSCYAAVCRNFAPLYGIDEESATGTSNASLTYYLYNFKALKENEPVYLFKQGIELNRPSIVRTKLIIGEDLNILVGGSAHITAEGTFT